MKLVENYETDAAGNEIKTDPEAGHEDAPARGGADPLPAGSLPKISIKSKMP
ncbi:MAG: hypothetical protein R3F11_16675 [Verrucomicrobiales bacterium]